MGQTLSLRSVDIQAEIMAQAVRRGAGKTLCPSEVARVLGGHAWRDLMPMVRRAGAALAAQGALRVTQRGRIVDLDDATGPVRFGLPVASAT